MKAQANQEKEKEGWCMCKCVTMCPCCACVHEWKCFWVWTKPTCDNMCSKHICAWLCASVCTYIHVCVCVRTAAALAHICQVDVKAPKDREQILCSAGLMLPCRCSAAEQSPLVDKEQNTVVKQKQQRFFCSGSPGVNPSFGLSQSSLHVL